MGNYWYYTYMKYVLSIKWYQPHTYKLVNALAQMHSFEYFKI